MDTITFKGKSLMGGTFIYKSDINGRNVKYKLEGIESKMISLAIDVSYLQPDAIENFNKALRQYKLEKYLTNSEK